MAATSLSLDEALSEINWFIIDNRTKIAALALNQGSAKTIRNWCNKQESHPEDSIARIIALGTSLHSLRQAGETHSDIVRFLVGLSPDGDVAPMETLNQGDVSEYLTQVTQYLVTG